MTVIQVQNLYHHFELRKHKKQMLVRLVNQFFFRSSDNEIQVLKNVSFAVAKGEIIGLIGPNGAGKSTLLRLLARIYQSDKGILETQGRIVSLIDLKLGSKDQLTVSDICQLLLTVYRVATSTKKLQQILKFSGLQTYQQAYLYQLSPGMTQRLTLAIALHAEADILLLDEVLETSDQEFRQKAVRKLQQLAKKGTAIMITSHDHRLISELCHRTLTLRNGQLKE